MELLEKLKNIKLEGNVNLNDHLKEIIKKMIENDEQNPFDTIERYSEQIIRSRGQMNQCEKRMIHDYKDDMMDICAELRKFLKIEPKIKKQTQDEEQEGDVEPENEELEPLNLGQIQNLEENERLLKQCGISIGRENVYYLQIAIKEFIKKYTPTKVIYWGRIMGQNRDYHILKVQVEAKEQEQEIPEDHEPEGTGINKDIYFVNNNILDVNNWTQLPLITSKQMRQSRNLRYIFSGDLEVDILTSPPFNGKEKHFLKTQVVRIDHGCTLIPKGDYKIKKEDDEEIDPTVFMEIEKEEEPIIKNLDFYRDINNWVYFYPNILQQGRITHQELKYREDDETEEEEKEKIKKHAISLDPFQERLKVIGNDKVNEQKQWIQNFYGKNLRVKHPLTGIESSDETMTLQNMLWPGYYLVYCNKKYFSVYFGDGNKYQNQEYYPNFEYKIQNEENEIMLIEEKAKIIKEEQEEQKDDMQE